MQFPNEDDPPLVLPGVRPWLISCDESGIDGARFYGFGSIWMSWDRRGRFYADMEALAADHGGARTNGQGGIRTHETREGLPVFKTGAFNRSATCPKARLANIRQRDTRKIASCTRERHAGRS